MIKKLLISVLLSMSAGFSYADPWHGFTTIEKLYPSFDGYFFLVNDPLTSHSSCDGGRRFHIKLDHPNYDAMVSSLLLAYSTKTKINMNVDGSGSPNCSASINRFIFE